MFIMNLFCEISGLRSEAESYCGETIPLPIQLLDNFPKIKCPSEKQQNICF